MDRNNIFEKLKSIICDVLDLEDAALSEDTCAEDIEGWDSLNHVQIVVAVQKEFNVKFTSSEIMKWDKVGNMIDSIEQKVNN